MNTCARLLEICARLLEICTDGQCILHQLAKSARHNKHIVIDRELKLEYLYAVTLIAKLLAMQH